MMTLTVLSALTVLVNSSVDPGVQALAKANAPLLLGFKVGDT
jgi:hypothetical protein